MKTDGNKLRFLADWFDIRYPKNLTPGVQNDLRRMAKRLDELDAENNIYACLTFDLGRQQHND